MNMRVILIVCLAAAPCYGNDDEPISPSLSSRIVREPRAVLSAVGDGIYGLVILASCALRDVPEYVSRFGHTDNSDQGALQRRYPSKSDWSPASPKKKD